MAVADCRIHEKQAAVSSAQRNGCVGKKSRVAAEYRRGQGAATAARNRECVGLVAIRNHGGDRTKDFQFVNQLSAVIQLQECGSNKRSGGGVGVERREWR